MSNLRPAACGRPSLEVSRYTKRPNAKKGPDCCPRGLRPIFCVPPDAPLYPSPHRRICVAPPGRSILLGSSMRSGPARLLSSLSQRAVLQRSLQQHKWAATAAVLPIDDDENRLRAVSPFVRFTRPLTILHTQLRLSATSCGLRSSGRGMVRSARSRTLATPWGRVSRSQRRCST